MTAKTKRKAPAKAPTPASELARLYDEGVRMRFDPETERLKAHHVDGDMTEAERATIKKHIKAFKKLTYWSEGTAKTVIRKMYEVTNARLSRCEDARADVAAAGYDWEDQANEAYANEDMGELRWACRKYVETTYKIIKARTDGE